MQLQHSLQSKNLNKKNFTSFKELVSAKNYITVVSKIKNKKKTR
jgi:hypothetical protein